MTTSIDFPTELPKALSGSLDMDAVDTFVDDASSVGSPRRRARFTRILEKFKFSLLLTEDELVILNDFYRTDLANGVKSFNWAHPLNGDIYEVHFDTMPKATHKTQDLYTVKIALSQI